MQSYHKKIENQDQTNFSLLPKIKRSCRFITLFFNFKPTMTLAQAYQQ